MVTEIYLTSLDSFGAGPGELLWNSCLTGLNEVLNGTPTTLMLQQDGSPFLLFLLEPIKNE